MSNTSNTGAALPTLTAEVAARAITAAEAAVYDGVMEYADPDDEDAWVEVGEDDESYAYPEGDAIKVDVYTSGPGLYLCVTVTLDRNFKVTDDGVEKAFADDAAEAAADAYTYGVETGWRSAME